MSTTSGNISDDGFVTIALAKNHNSVLRILQAASHRTCNARLGERDKWDGLRTDWA
ncbi:hypothetical protein [Tardiphaga sp.]|jgi:hypothetical protein|uniref:hypothetical protein n=1 Tax=Tardiphaga sp. TaxID=1926292 RepID=UPI0037DA0267